jgi:hypothetical protein
MPDPRPDLREIYAEAIGFARAHGVDPFTADDFALQRSEAGMTHATYADGDHLVNVYVDRDGKPTYAVAELAWVHDDADPDRDLCDFCEVIGREAIGELDDDEDDGLLRVYLPGDPPIEGPAATAEELEAALRAAVVRDERGALRRRDGTYIADPDTTVEQLHAKIGAHAGDESPRARYLRESYMLALDLLAREVAEAATVDAAHAQFVDGIRERLDLDAGLTEIVGEAVPGE